MLASEELKPTYLPLPVAMLLIVVSNMPDRKVITTTHDNLFVITFLQQAIIALKLLVGRQEVGFG